MIGNQTNLTNPDLADSSMQLRRWLLPPGRAVVVGLWPFSEVNED